MCCLANILERLVNNKLRSHLSLFSVYTPYQSGFRPSHGPKSTTFLRERLSINILLSGLTIIFSIAVKLRTILGFLHRNKNCFHIYHRKRVEPNILFSLFWIMGVLHGKVPASTLTSLAAVYQLARIVMSGNAYRTQNCLLYRKVNWLSLAVRQHQRFLSVSQSFNTDASTIPFNSEFT